MEELKGADLPCFMITGDNPLTAASIGYQCGISNPDKATSICNYSDQMECFTLEKFSQEDTIQNQ